MKCLCCLILSTLLTSAAVGPPGVEWHMAAGRVNVARPTADGGYVVGGSFNDNYWIRRLNPNGTFLWETKGQRPGNNFEDPVTDFQQTSDGGFIVLVETDPSIAGFGVEDCQVIRLDSGGGVIWDRTFGADGNDRPQPIRQLPDGSFVFGASFNAGTNGNRTSTNYGGFDWWFVRLDANGNKVAERSFGGSGGDFLETLTLTADGGFALVGESSSPASGNKTSPNYGGSDFWVVRLNAAGDKVWDRSFGGNADDYALSVWETNGVLVVGGVSQSSASGNKTNATMGTWIIGLDAGGNKLWERAIADATEFPTTAILPAGDGGFFLGGNAPLPTNYCCPLMFRVARISPQDESMWELTYPGTFFLETMERTRDGGLILGGGSDVLKTTPDALSAPPILKAISTGGHDYYITLTGSSNTDYALERSSNLVFWQSIATNRLFGSQTQMVFQTESNLNQVFHRARVVR